MLQYKLAGSFNVKVDVVDLLQAPMGYLALNKLNKEVKNSGLTIIPLKLYISKKGFAKIKIALAKGKKLYDKRENIKDRDNKRDLERIKKSFNQK